MNEYTRREEVRATFIASAILVLCIAAAVFRLVTVQGKLVPDPVAQKQAQESEIRVTSARACALAGERLVTEIEVFKKLAKTARVPDPNQADAGAPPPAPRRRFPAPKKQPETDSDLAWAAAQPSYKQAKVLAGCREPTEAIAGVRAAAAPAWDALKKAAVVTPPSDVKAEQIQATSELLSILGDIPADEIAQATKDAETAYKAAADRDRDRADTAMIRLPLPEGLLSRRWAVSIGVALTVCALLLSYISVRVGSTRRLTTLLPLREAARTGNPGIQAAAILKAAAAHNSGEPGIVIGAAMGGLLAALVNPVDADMFVIGVMVGLLVGLGIQWAARLAVGAGRWRARATELAEIEKPAIPIVLVLSGVNAGLEAEFIQFFNGLPPQDAAATVEKLAAQAEERILAAADAGAAAALQQQQPPR